MESTIGLIWSYLDNMTLSADAPQMENMLPVITKALHKVGLSLNMDSTIALVPIGLGIAGCPMLQKIASINTDQCGLVVCGQPLDNTTTLSGQPPGATPIGDAILF